MREGEVKVTMDLLGCWICQECGICVRKPVVNKWSKPGRKARWTAEGKIEGGLPRIFSWNDSLQLVDQELQDFFFFFFPTIGITSCFGQAFLFYY